MGKWSHLKDKLPPLPDANPKHKELVDEAKKRFVDKSLREINELYAKIRALKVQKEGERAALQIQQDAVEAIIIEKYDEMGTSNMKTEFGTISTSPEPYASTTDPKAMIQWVKDDGLEDSLTLPWQTLNKHLKLLLEAGQEPMPGVEAYIRTKVSFRKKEE